MSVPQRSARSALIAAALATMLLFAGCASAADGGGDDQDASSDTSDASADSEAGEVDGEGDLDDGGEGTDGEEDPEQEVVRSGPIADYGGPAYGDQGEAQVIEPGVWCKTLAVFWGGDQPIPDGVRFTFDEAVVDPVGLEVTDAACGTDPGSGEELASCIGLTVDANASVFCGLEVRPGESFTDGTTVTFLGTLECPTSEVCDEVAGRQVEPGPPVVVNTPEGA